MRRVTRWLWALLKREPVAVWGTVIAAVLNAVALPLHLSRSETEGIASALILLGIPVVRSQVSPVAALKALVRGAEAERSLPPVPVTSDPPSPGVFPDAPAGGSVTPS